MFGASLSNKLQRRWRHLSHRFEDYRYRTGTRYDIQGLRAVAVLAVVVDHATGWPGGGFIGVDVFFVISGFLITGLMLNEHERSGRISLLAFYRRRVKRLMPAALTTLVVTSLVGYFVFFEDRWRTSVVDAVWAALFAANWRFLRQQTDYFASAGPVSPFQHFWSLSVEEQFYFVWPLLLIVLLGAFGARATLALDRPLDRRLAAAGIAVLGAASFWYALGQSSDDPVAAYFSTPARMWELSAGALLALGRPLLREIPDGLRPALAWAGLGVIGYGIATIDGTSGFPAPIAAIPVVGAMLVLAAGTTADGEQLPFVPLLTNPLSRYIGDVSYSLYLWHFPVIVLADAWYGHGQGPYWVVVLVSMTVLSLLSYHYIETPFRTSPYFEPFESHRQRDVAVRAWRSKWARPFGNLGMGVAAMTILIVVAGQLQSTTSSTVTTTSSGFGQGGQNGTGGKGGKGGKGGQGGSAQAMPANAAITSELAAALQATGSWPELNPPLDDPTRDGAGDFDACLAMTPTSSGCVGGTTGKPVIAVVGDSTAVNFLTTVTAALGSRYEIRGFTKLSCAFAVESKDPRAQDADCPGFLQQTAGVLAQIKPVMTIVMENYADVVFDAKTSDYQSQLTDWGNGTKAIEKLLLPTTQSLVFASAPPEGPSISDCATRTGGPSDCVYQPQFFYPDVKRVVEQEMGGRTHFVDVQPWFCVDDNCPAFADGTLLKEDQVHATIAWAKKLGPAAAEVLDPLLPKRS